jgi:hypothetical protein
VQYTLGLSIKQLEKRRCSTDKVNCLGAVKLERRIFKVENKLEILT